MLSGHLIGPDRARAKSLVFPKVSTQARGCAIRVRVVPAQILIVVMPFRVIYRAARWPPAHGPALLNQPYAMFS